MVKFHQMGITPFLKEKGTNICLFEGNALSTGTQFSLGIKPFSLVEPIKTKRYLDDNIQVV